VGAQHGATLFVTLLAAFDVLIARLSSAESVVIGIPMASQALESNGHLVAHGVNTIPLPCRVDLQRSFAEHLREVRSTFLDAQSHQRLTFGSVVQKLKLPRDPGRNPLVSVIFNIDRMGSPFDFEDVDLEDIEAPKAFFNFELGVNAIDNGESILLECDYNSDLFDAATILRWLDAYDTMLRAILADSSQPVGRLPLLSPAARHELLALQPARTDYDPSVLMHEFIERQVDRTPDRPALSFQSQTLSYAEVDAEANRIAHALRRMGVRRGVAVGLCVERGIGMVVSIIGILKAGGTHVPLDPAFPSERLSFMVKDSALAVLITQEQHRAATPCCSKMSRRSARCPLPGLREMTAAPIQRTPPTSSTRLDRPAGPRGYKFRTPPLRT
jgi:non-ribosomal peptide synthetase component F